MQRGEVWWAQFDEQHPVVLLSEDSAPDSAPDQGHQDGGMRAVQLVPASGMDVSGLGREVPVAGIDGLPSDAVVRVAFPRPGFVPCTWVTTVAGTDLIEYLGTLSPANLADIDEALALGDVIVSDTEGEAAESALAAIRQSLRQGTVVTRQITRL